jgi:hypothetical protein
MTMVGSDNKQKRARGGHSVAGFPRVSAVAAQAMLVLGLGGWLLLAPPSEGMMMLVPLSPAAARALPSLALRDDTRLVAAGSIPGSLLVYGRRDALAGRLLAHGVVTMASPPGGCGARAAA